MKVLKKVDTSQWSYRHTCEKCDTELEAERGDVKYQHYSGDMREASYDSWYIECPICPNVIYLSADKIPRALQAEIKSGKCHKSGLQFVDQWVDENNKTLQRKE